MPINEVKLAWSAWNYECLVFLSIGWCVLCVVSYGSTSISRYLVSTITMSSRSDNRWWYNSAAILARISSLKWIDALRYILCWQLVSISSVSRNAEYLAIENNALAFRSMSSKHKMPKSNFSSGFILVHLFCSCFLCFDIRKILRVLKNINEIQHCHRFAIHRWKRNVYEIRGITISSHETKTILIDAIIINLMFEIFANLNWCDQECLVPRRKLFWRKLFWWKSVGTVVMTLKIWMTGSDVWLIVWHCVDEYISMAIR